MPFHEPDRTRLDVWLDVACLFKTRSDAQRACKLGQILVDGVVAKPHREVRVGAEIVINRPNGRKQTVVVRGVRDTHVARAAARELYEDRTPPPTPAEIERRRVDQLFRAVTGPARRLNRKEQRHAAQRKFTM